MRSMDIAIGRGCSGRMELTASKVSKIRYWFLRKRVANKFGLKKNGAPE